MIASRLLKVADSYYARSQAGIAALPARCRPAIRAAGLIYAEIGRQIERNGMDSVNHRAVTSKSRKLVLLAGALGDAVWMRAPLARREGEASEASFLLEAVESQQGFGPATATLKPLWHYSGWGDDLFGLLTRVEQRKQAQQAS